LDKANLPHGLSFVASQRRRKAYRVDTPIEEHSLLSQKEPQPRGRQILLDIASSNILLGGIDYAAKAEDTFVSRGESRFSRRSPRNIGLSVHFAVIKSKMQVLMDSGVVANTVTARYGAALGICF
jgi:hypothetical protein